MEDQMVGRWVDRMEGHSVGPDGGPMEDQTGGPEGGPADRRVGWWAAGGPDGGPEGGPDGGPEGGPEVGRSRGDSLEGRTVEVKAAWRRSRRKPLPLGKSMALLQLAQRQAKKRASTA